MAINDATMAREEEKRHLHAAIEWLIAQSPPHTLTQIEEAAQRFDLSPLDENFLIRQFIQSETELSLNK